MTPPPELPFLDSPEKDALIVALIARIDALVAENTVLRTRIAELEAKVTGANFRAEGESEAEKCDSSYE
jgi:hypothetical protein